MGKKIAFMSYQQLYRDTLRLVPKLPQDISSILGIPRSGMLPASMLATEMHLLLGMASETPEVAGGRRLRKIAIGAHTLVIDDSVSTGRAMQKAKDAVAVAQAHGTIKRATFACIYLSKGSENHVDKFARHLQTPRIFEWNLFNSGIARRSMFDMDGVLCLDPPEDDDGVKYKAYITSAPPLHLPKYPIQAICTNRLCKWRTHTETWLNQHGITYKQLIMRPEATAKERRKARNPGEYKGYHFRRSEAAYFIESSRIQAPIIAQVSGKPVICLQDRKVY